MLSLPDRETETAKPKAGYVPEKSNLGGILMLGRGTYDYTTPGVIVSQGEVIADPDIHHATGGTFDSKRLKSTSTLFINSPLLEEYYLFLE
jgi:hypothetical protein